MTETRHAPTLDGDSCLWGQQLDVRPRRLRFAALTWTDVKRPAVTEDMLANENERFARKMTMDEPDALDIKINEMNRREEQEAHENRLRWINRGL